MGFNELSMANKLSSFKVGPLQDIQIIDSTAKLPIF